MLSIKTHVFVWDGPAAWYFATIKKSAADKLKKSYNAPRRGFGSIPVKVQVGNTKWETSIFPEKDGNYLLPIKKEVRKKENVVAGMKIDVKMALR